MTDRATLLALADRVEAAEGANLVLERDIALAIYHSATALTGNDARISVWDGNGRTQLTVKPYTASLDAAMTLVPNGWAWMAGCDPGDGYFATLMPTDESGIVAHGVNCNAATPALALCAAALRARAEAGDE